MIKYVKYQNKNEDSKAYGKWYARVKNTEKTVTLEDLAEHMAEHNTPYSAGAIAGVLTDMVVCIRHLVLDGRTVKLPNLAIFKAGISCTGADAPENFNVKKNVKRIYLKARGTGIFQTNAITRAGNLGELEEYTKPKDENQQGDIENP